MKTNEAKLGRVPLPFPSALVQPGESVTCHLSPQRSHRGWYGEAEQARELDRMATVEHLADRARADEPGDAWETPTDES